MTSIDSLAALIRTDLAAHIARDDHSNDYATFRINYDLMRIAARELAYSLTLPDDPSFRYYYSDSTHDELRNPATIIAECRDFFDADYDELPELIDCAHLLAENIDYMTNYDLTQFDDADREFATIDELAAYIAELAN